MKLQKPQYVLGILVLLLMFVLCACSSYSDSGIVQSRRGTGTKRKEAAEQILETEAEIEMTEESGELDLYIITKIDTNRKTAVFEKVGSKRQSQYAYDTGTRFLDKYGDTKAITAFLPGDVVNIQVSSSTQQLKSVQLSDKVWVQEDIVKYSVDTDIHAFTIGQTRYSYDPKMDVFSGESKVGLASIGKSDVLRAVGMDKELISVSVTKGHGYLALANTKLFEGSFICIGDKIFEEVTPNMQVEVPEGEYLVTVANNGYGGNREVTIGRNQTTSLNLDELKGEGPKVCKITFDVGVEGAVLKIDGKETDYSKPVKVQYGVHTITVEAEGYDPITQKLVANSKKAEIEIALTSASGEKASEENRKENSEEHSSNNNTNNNNANKSNTNSSDTSNDTSNDTNNDANKDTSSTDYLTTLYNLLTSINNNSNTSNTGNSYENLSDG